MEFRLLGPFEVIADGAPVNLGGRQRRTLLAILTVHAGETVSTEKLIDELWGDSPPSAARKSVQAHVAHLRRVINREDEILASSDEGYILQVDSESIDSRLFEGLLATARDMRSTDPLGAAETLEQALLSFRGPPLAGIADDAFSLRVEASRLEELQLSAVEGRLAALLDAGEASAVAADAERLVSEHPLRERLWGTLMLALYRSGRQAEALRAYSRARQVLAGELGIEPSKALQQLEQAILDQDPTLDEFHGRTPEALSAGRPVVRNPYKGLRAFDEADSADFFGREDLVRRLEERLDSRSSTSLTILAGPSGAGKSSVVRAGLIPRLRDGDTRVAVMFPGDDPFSALAKSIAEVADRSPDQVRAVIDGGDPIEVVVVVDQLEELFTMVDDPMVTDRFLDLMSGSLPGARWVVTVRADFLDRLLSHPRLGSLVNDALVLVPPLQDHEVRAAITGPAERVGFNVEPELVAAVTNDVKTRPSALPLLQYALTDTFERRDGDSLALSNYRSAGGISGALAKRADGLFESLEPRQQRVARDVFLQLVTVTDTGEEARRRVEREALVDIEDADVTGYVIDRFGAVRLLTFDQDPDSGKPTVEVAHAALLSEWPRLARWIEEARHDLRTRQRLALAVAEWEEAGREASFLLSGARLAEMESWRETTSVMITPEATSLLNESRAAEMEADRRRTNRRRFIATALGVGAAISLVFALVATRSAQIATVQRLAAASSANLEGDPELALLLALEAVRSSPGDALPEAEEALHFAIQGQRALLTRPSEGVAFFSPDGTRFLGSADGDLIVFDLESGNQAMRLNGHSGRVFNGVWSPDGSVIATNSRDGTTRLWDSNSGEQIWSIDVGSTPVSVAISPDSDLLATSYGLFERESPCDCVVRVWDIASQELVAELPHSGPLGVNFGPGDMLAVADWSAQSVEIWDSATWEAITSIPLDSRPGDVAFPAEGDFLVAAAGPDTVVVDTSTWEVRHRLSGLASEEGGVDISPDGSQIAAGDIDGSVTIWNSETGRQAMTLQGQRAAVFNVAFSPDGALLASAAEDSTTKVWDLTDERVAESWILHAHGSDIDFDPDGRRLAAAGVGAGVWAVPPGERQVELQGHEDKILRIKFSPDGNNVITTSDDATARIWNPNTGEQELLIQHQEPVGSAAFSPDGLQVATAGNTDVYLWSRSSGEMESVLSDLHSTDRPDRREVFDVEYSSDGRSVITAGGDGWLRMWQREGGALQWETRAHTGSSFDLGIPQIDVSPDGELLASVGFDGALHLWDALSGKAVRSLETGAGGELRSVDFSPDGTRVAAAGTDGRVSVWDADGTRKVTVGKVPATVSSVEFAPDGSKLVVASEDDRVTAYILDVERLAVLGLSRLTRWWADEECARLLHEDSCPAPPEGLEAFDAEG